MSETPKSITKRKCPEKVRTQGADPEMLYSFKTIPVSKAMVNRLIKELDELPSKVPPVKTITQFYINNGFRRRTYYDLLAKYPELREAHDQAIHYLGERLWERAVDKQVDWAPVKHRLWRYSPEFKEDYEFHASIASQIKNAESGDGKVQYIVVDTTGKKLSD